MSQGVRWQGAIKCWHSSAFAHGVSRFTKNPEPHGTSRFTKKTEVSAGLRVGSSRGTWSSRNRPHSSSTRAAGRLQPVTAPGAAASERQLMTLQPCRRLLPTPGRVQTVVSNH